MKTVYAAIAVMPLLVSPVIVVRTGGQHPYGAGESAGLDPLV